MALPTGEMPPLQHAVPRAVPPPAFPSREDGRSAGWALDVVLGPFSCEPRALDKGDRCHRGCKALQALPWSACSLRVDLGLTLGLLTTPARA